MTFPASLDLFCRVVDNFGDIGVCWRLARQLRSDHGFDVTLWVDDLASFRKICSDVDPQLANQRVQDVVVRQWKEDFGAVAATDIPDIVIEAFACELPPAYLAAMAARTPKPVWINLEYLSAEPWVEDCHALPSRHPSLPLSKYFFFPGFSDRTGGLLLERGLDARRQRFQQEPETAQAFLAGLGVNRQSDARLISLFCYPPAPVESLFNSSLYGTQPTLCLVPEGIASEVVGAFLGESAVPGATATRGALTVQVLPFVDQPDYDRLLWSCDLNFVRGEDSFVRAQWAARPFVWHIYPQEDAAHLVKLDAFLARYTKAMSAQSAAAVKAMWHAWNHGQDIGEEWRPLAASLPELSHRAGDWSRQLARNGDLVSNLMQFVKEIG